jgi:hypothetical protein
MLHSFRLWYRDSASKWLLCPQPPLAQQHLLNFIAGPLGGMLITKLAYATFLNDVRLYIQNRRAMKKPASIFSKILPITNLTVIITILAFLIQGCKQQTSDNYKTSLQKPTGPYAIGSRFFYLYDKNRPDFISPEPDDYRAISLQVWYPAKPGHKDQPIILNDRNLMEAYVQEGYFYPEFLTEWALEPTHSYLNAKPAKTKTPYPVILYSSSGVMNANTFLSEELASHGYVVFSIGHPYWCEFYFDEYGKSTPLDKNNEYYRQLWEEEGSWQVLKAKKEITLAKTLEERADLYKQLNLAMPTEVSDLRLWGEDIGFVINQLKEMNSQTGFFKGIMDVNRIGVMGYSKGGAAAGQYCLTADDRCKAGINLGGFMFADIVEKNLKKPFLIMTHIEPWAPDGFPIGELFFNRSESSAYLVAIKDALHGNFVDISAAKKYVKVEGILGPIDGDNFLKIMQYYVLTFFDKYVKELPGTEIKDLQDQYPEVNFKSRIADAKK